MSLLIIHFSRYGPYHYARLHSAIEMLSPLGWNVVGLEVSNIDLVYPWEKHENINSDKVITLFPQQLYEKIKSSDLRSQINITFNQLKPAVVAIAGWGTDDARLCLQWCNQNRVQTILMSETRENDGVRSWWKEIFKSYIVRKFDMGLVGGESHKKYLIKLGLPKSNIKFGYNIVDNLFFSKKTKKHHHNYIKTYKNYFLASNRFIKRKNLSLLINAYSKYVSRYKNKNYLVRSENNIWNLCLLGDGELKSDLINECHNLGLNVKESNPWDDLSSQINNVESFPTVYFVGFRQINELSEYYAKASCFVHPAIEEPWGLVINEAMSCGLPIISGDNVGAAEELVIPDINGWSFNSHDVNSLLILMEKISSMDKKSYSLLCYSSLKILEQRCPTNAFGQGIIDLLKLSSNN